MLHFEVSRRIKEEFENGRPYYALHGQPISKRTLRSGEIRWQVDYRDGAGVRRGKL